MLAPQKSCLRLFLRQNTFSLLGLPHPQAGAVLERDSANSGSLSSSSKGPPNGSRSRSAAGPGRGKHYPLPQGHKISPLAAENENQKQLAVSSIRTLTGQNSKPGAFNRGASEGLAHSRFSTSIFRPDNRARRGRSLMGLITLIGIRGTSRMLVYQVMRGPAPALNELLAVGPWIYWPCQLRCYERKAEGVWDPSP